MRTQRNLMACVLVGSMIVVFLFGLRALTGPGIRETTWRDVTRWHLKEIACAFHCYAEEHGALPPPAIYSNEGKPLLSWRVALLPYLKNQALYDEFHLDEPWDGPHNIKLLPKMPSVFRDLAPDAPPQQTSTTFRVFVGPGTPFEGPRGIK